MAGSLFDQLKKSGLVDEKKAQKIKKEKYQQTKKKKGKKAKPQVSESAQLAAEAAAKNAERDRQLNLERQQQQQKKELQAAVRQVIQSNQLKGYDGDVSYNFADGSKVKTLNVNAKVHKQLSNETVRVARFGNGYALIPAEAVEKIESKDASVLIPLQSKDSGMSKEDEDYYAQFEIPDDLVW